MSAVRNKNLRPKNLPANSVTTLNFPNNSNASSGTNSNNNRNTTSKLRPLTATKSKLGPYTPRVENLKNRVKRIKQQVTSVRNVRPATKRAPNTAGPRPSPNVRPATKKRKIIPNRNVRPATANNKNNATRIIKNSKKQIENNKKSLLNIRKTIQKAQNTLKTIKKPTSTKRMATPVATNKVLTLRKRRKPVRYANTNANANARARAKATANAAALEKKKGAKANAAVLDANNRDNVGTRTPARRVANTNKTTNTRSLINRLNLRTQKDQSRDNIMDAIKSLIDENKNEPEDDRNMLTYIYQSVLSAKRVEQLAKIPESEFKIRIKKQLAALKTGRSDGGRGIQMRPKSVTLNKKSLTLSEDHKMDIIFLIWCDMMHDNSLAINEENRSLSKFNNSNIINLLFGKEKRTFRYTAFIKNVMDILQKELERNPTQGFIKVNKTKNKKNKNAVTDIIKAGTGKKTWSPGYESVMKTHILGIITAYDKNNNKNTALEMYRNTEDIVPSQINDKLFKELMYVSIDQEDDLKGGSIGILKSKMESGFRSLQPVLSISNIIDPGSNMPIQTLSKNKVSLNRENVNDIKVTSVWNVIPYEVSVGTMKVTTELRKNEKGRHLYHYIINGESYPSNITKKQAASGNDKDSISKFMGDFYQILTAIRMQNAKKGDPIYLPLSGDGMFCVIYAYLSHNVFGETPKMIYIKGKGTDPAIKLAFMNLKDKLNVKYNKNESTKIQSIRSRNSKSSSNSMNYRGNNNNNNVTSS